MIFRFLLLRRWMPPVTSIEGEKDFVGQINKFGIPALAKRIAPFPTRILYVSLLMTVISGLIGWWLDMQRPLNALGRGGQVCAAVFFAWGIIQSVISIFMGVLNYGGAVNWLTRIQKHRSDSEG